MAILTVPTSVAEFKHLEAVVDAANARNKNTLANLGCNTRGTGASRTFQHHHQNGSINNPHSTPALG